MTKIPVTTDKGEKPEGSLASFAERLVDSGAPALPPELTYVVQCDQSSNYYRGSESAKVVLDIYSKDQKKLLASQETVVSVKLLNVRDFVKLAQAAFFSLSFESRLAKPVRELLYGGSE